MIPDTLQIVDGFYSAYVGGDQGAMLALLSSSVSGRFLGSANLVRVSEVRDFLAFNENTSLGLEFCVRHRVSDGEWTAVIWSETATVAATAAPWWNQGADLLRILTGEIDSLHVNNDVQIVRQHLPDFENSSEPQHG